MYYLRLFSISLDKIICYLRLGKRTYSTVVHTEYAYDQIWTDPDS